MKDNPSIVCSGISSVKISQKFRGSTVQAVEKKPTKLLGRCKRKRGSGRKASRKTGKNGIPLSAGTVVSSEQMGRYYLVGSIPFAPFFSMLYWHSRILHTITKRLFRYYLTYRIRFHVYPVNCHHLHFYWTMKSTMYVMLRCFNRLTFNFFFINSITDR